jgi:membrane-bound lytic murein transglycosylase D
MPEHPAVDRWLRHYAAYQGAEIENALRRAFPFRRHIAEQVQLRGLPRELLFLPVLESHYRAEAVSRSGATGLWQIMANTSGPLGLRRDLWLDERRDFWLSTDAALRKLEENFRRFGSWPLALAAYNCGAGCLARAIRAGGSSDFWQLRARGLLPGETAEYVPKFYALVRICGYPERHGLRNLAAGEDAPPAWTRLQLERSVELALLAELGGLDRALLAAANAELNFEVTPPASHRYALKVPAESEPRVRALLSDPAAELLRYQLHSVRTGDTFYRLAGHYGVAVELIRSANPAIDPRRMQIGSVLKVPVIDGQARTPPAPVLSDATEFTDGYIIQSGDTLWAISRRHGTTPELLAAVNGLGLDDLLRPGDTLKVPGDEVSRGGVTQEGADDEQ